MRSRLNDSERSRIVHFREWPVSPYTSMDQLLSPQDERIVSANPSTSAAPIGPSRDVSQHQGFSNEGGDLSVIHPNSFASHEQNITYGGYGNNTGTWDGYPQYLSADGLHVSPVIYNENPSLMLHSGYGFSPEMAYGQYSPVATPLPSVMIDGQLFSPQQIPFSPTYYPQPATPNMASAVQASPSEVISESSNDNMIFGPGSNYMVQFGSFGGGNISGNHNSNSLVSATYPQPMGILGAYEHNVGQGSLHGFGFASGSSGGQYPYRGSYPSSDFGSTPMPYMGPNDRTKYILEKSRRREKDHDSASISNDSHVVDRNRGPRAAKLKGKGTNEESSPSENSKSLTAMSTVNFDLYNQSDFVTDYENAKFFIIKSFSEDNVHKSIKYNVWASTPHGNKKLDAAYREAKEMTEHCPLFLLFSVNASGQFCGVAEMIGPVDFEKDAEYWQQDRWNGQFPVCWHIIKDVPNGRFRHIILQNNDNKPVTHSRDSQEVKLEQGIDMLRIFKDYDARTSILDDFDFYDDRERALKERKAKQQSSSTKFSLDINSSDNINQISDNFCKALTLADGSVKVPANGASSGGSSKGVLASLVNKSSNETAESSTLLE